jgi:hypothetical protein
MKTKAATYVLHGHVATGNVSALMASTLKARGTLRKAARVNWGIFQECSSLSSFSSDIMSWVSRHNASQSSQADGSNRCKMNHGQGIDLITRLRRAERSKIQSKDFRPRLLELTECE